MNRIEPMDPSAAQGKTKELLDMAKAKMGRIPNVLKIMARAPSVLQSYLMFSQALEEAKLPAKVREQIALAMAEYNQCAYCLAAHAAIGKLAGLTPEEIEKSRRVESSDFKTHAILRFAKELFENRGRLADEDLAAVREAGCSDEEVLEIVAAVALNLLTNYINHVADTALDFPKAPSL